MKKKLLSIVILVLMVCLNISITVEVFATSASKDVSVESILLSVLSLLEAQIEI